MGRLLKPLAAAAAAVLLLALALAVGCTVGFEVISSSTGGGGGGESGVGYGPPEGEGKLEDWKIEPGNANTIDPQELKIEAAKAPDGTDAMAVYWATDVNLMMCELFAKLPAGYDYSVFDGLIFEVWVDVCQNMMFAVRNPPINQKQDPNVRTGEAWFIAQPNNYQYNAGWRTIAENFDQAYAPGWGNVSPTESILNEWLKNQYAQWQEDPEEAKDIVVSINPQLNAGITDPVAPPAVSLPKGNVEGTVYINYYKRIGFYKSASGAIDYDEGDEICWIWNFSASEEESE